MIQDTRITLAGLAMAAVLFVAVNVFSNATFNSLRLDLTEDKLYTISEGTRKVLGGLAEPVKVRLYFSKVLAERSPAHAVYHGRVRELLEQYRDISAGKIQLELNNPEPFSDTEDRAVAFGLKGVPLNSVGDKGYFGLAATNSTDGQEVIPFFNMDREQFIEYDLTKLIHSLVTPHKKVMGMLSTLPIDGERDAQGRQRSQQWRVIDQIREFFDVLTVDAKANALPGGMDILMIVHPKGLSDKMLYAIDQFVLKGGRALVFADSNAEFEMLSSAQTARAAGPSDFNKLLNAWGVTLVKGKVAGDLDAARRVNAGMGEQVVVADYVAWLSLSKGNFDEGEVTTSDIASLNLATAGVLEKADGATTKMIPIITTGPRSMLIDAEKVRLTPDVVALFRSFQPSGKPLTLAARLKGDANSAFADAPPEGAENHLGQSSQPINVIVVSDADMLHDRFWVRASDFLGQRVLMPFANNADFVVNALDNLSGSGALIGLRGRGRTERPFHMVESIRIEAERKFRAKEELLLNKLKDSQTKLDQLQGKRDETGNAGEAILSAQDKESLDKLRISLVTTRKELRDVQHELRKDIERLDFWLKFLNIAAIPLLLGGVLIVLMVFRRPRRKAVTP